jgi:hypothetical protein
MAEEHAQTTAAADTGKAHAYPDGYDSATHDDEFNAAVRVEFERVRNDKRLHARIAKAKEDGSWQRYEEHFEQMRRAMDQTERLKRDAEEEAKRKEEWSAIARKVAPPSDRTVMHEIRDRLLPNPEAALNAVLGRFDKFWDWCKSALDAVLDRFMSTPDKQQPSEPSSGTTSPLPESPPEPAPSVEALFPVSLLPSAEAPPSPPPPEASPEAALDTLPPLTLTRWFWDGDPDRGIKPGKRFERSSFKGSDNAWFEKLYREAKKAGVEKLVPGSVKPLLHALRDEGRFDENWQLTATYR